MEPIQGGHGFGQNNSRSRANRGESHSCAEGAREWGTQVVSVPPAGTDIISHLLFKVTGLSDLTDGTAER